MLKKQKFLKFQILRKIERGILKKLSIFRILKFLTFYVGKASKWSKTNIKQVFRVKNGQKREKNKFLKNENFLKFRIFCYFG